MSIVKIEDKDQKLLLSCEMEKSETEVSFKGFLGDEEILAPLMTYLARIYKFAEDSVEFDKDEYVLIDDEKYRITSISFGYCGEPGFGLGIRRYNG